MLELKFKTSVHLYGTCPRVPNLEHEAVSWMFPYPLKDSAKLWESDTITTVQMKHHSEACSGPQSKDDNINALSNNNTCNYPRQRSVSYLPTVEGCTESTTKNTKQENHMHKHTHTQKSLFEISETSKTSQQSEGYVLLHLMYKFNF